MNFSLDQNVLPLVHETFVTWCYPFEGCGLLSFERRIFMTMSGMEPKFLEVLKSIDESLKRVAENMEKQTAILEKMGPHHPR